jgi:hypothetical protein
MSVRTSQLQIRVTPQEKAALKRLAASAGQNVSTYVLSRALPSSERDLSRVLDELRTAKDPREALGALARFVSNLADDELAGVLAPSSLGGLAPLAQNRVAALIEDEAHRRGTEPPAWTSDIPPLPRPHFRWPLVSLRPLQIRLAGVAFKRRNVFDPSISGSASAAPSQKTPPELASLAAELEILELEVEFYFIAGAILSATLPTRTGSARPDRLLRPRGDQMEPKSPQERVPEVVRALVGQAGPSGRFLELPRIQVFAPPVEYALAMKVASLPPDSPRAVDDIRFLLRLLNLGTAAAATDVISRYVAERHLPAHARDVLQRL